MPVGRPPVPSMPFDQEIGDYICEQFSTAPVSMATILKRAKDVFEDGRVPSIPTVFKWLRDNPDFVKDYEASKQCQADLLFEDTLDIADDSSNDWEERKHFAGDDTSPQVNGEAIARARLRIDTRKWIAAHLRPKKYGDKIDIDQKTTLEASDPLMALLTQVAQGGAKLVNDSND